MYFKRKIDAYLESWKATQKHHPLVVQGARQIGKTESIMHFAEKNYKSVIRINFVEEPKYKVIIERGYSAEAIIQMISLVNPSHRFIPHETLIFWDEIQEFPEIATALKFFDIDGRYDVICSGSMLGVQYKRVNSFSMGYKTDFTMRSMDFDEYLWACGYGDDLREIILEHMVNLRPFTEGELNLIQEKYMDYIIMGGMPAIVSDFIESKTFSNTLSMQKQLVLEYGNDIRKYTEGLDQAKVISVFESVPSQLAKENKKFQFSKISHGAKARDYWGCVEWLRDAGIVTPCHCLLFPELPLKGNSNMSKFKLYISDTGLLVSMLDKEAQDDLKVRRNLGVYKGAIYENMVGEALSKSGYSLYYYKREDSTLEEDFFVRDTEQLYPVEVKATNGRMKSLRTLIESDKYHDIRHGFKFASANIGKTDTVTTFPYFCAFLLKEYLESRTRR